MNEQLSERGKDLVKYMPQAVNALADRIIEKLGERLLYEEKPQTNADRIRSMTDEELTEFMVKTIGNSFCPPSIADDSIEEVCRGKSGGCMRCWLDWLKEEAMQNDS